MIMFNFCDKFRVPTLLKSSESWEKKSFIEEVESPWVCPEAKTSKYKFQLALNQQ